MLRHELRHQTRVEIVDVARLGGRYDRDCLALVERGLREQGRTPPHDEA
jgi:hypothetical protein